MTDKDRKEFRQYLRQCTDRQVVGCYEKEKKAQREDYMELCESEAFRRGVFLEGEDQD